MLVITGALNRLEDPFTLYEKSESIDPNWIRLTQIRTNRFSEAGEGAREKRQVDLRRPRSSDLLDVAVHSLAQ